MKIKPLILPEKELKASAQQRKKNTSLENIITYRIRLFVFFIFSAMSLILYQAYSIQIMQAEYYSVKLFNQTTKKHAESSLRGVIMDRNGEILVGNRQMMNLVFEPSEETDFEKLAGDIAAIFDFDLSQMSDQDLREAVLFFKSREHEACQAVISIENCLADFKKRKGKEKQERGLTNDQKEYFMIYKLLQDASYNIPSVIKKDISIEEAAVYLEHSHDLAGLSLEFDWEREYPDFVHVRSLLGRVSSSSAGIFEENLKSYLAKGYSLNDKIGVSGVEYVYEDLLKGKKEISVVSMDEKGKLNNQIIEKGQRGYDLTLTLDMNLQNKAEKIAREILEREKNNPRRIYMNQILLVVMNPNNGDILCMVSMNRSDKGEYYNDSSLTYVQSFVPGSVVKGATLYMGLDQGVINPNEIMIDEPLKLANSPSKASWKNLGAINDIQALALSSNVYMMKIALRLAGTHYAYNGGLFVKEGTFDLLRSYYNSFGLGVLTQADVYHEQIGYIGNDSKDGNILDYVIGQYDTYTVLELAQYVSTIANGGKRLKPRIMLKATLPSKKDVVYTNDVEILNVLENREALERIQQGFRACVTSGLCTALQDESLAIAAKTGTAEAYLQIENKEGQLITVPSPNNSVIAYAPYKDPEIAVACMIPHAWNGSVSQSNLCLEAVKEITEFIFDK